jgi:hypothetical protein
MSEAIVRTLCKNTRRAAISRAARCIFAHATCVDQLAVRYGGI